MRQLSREAEDQLRAAAQSAVEQAVAGGDPNDLLAKVAFENGYNPDMTDRLINCFNTARALAHYGANPVGVKRASEFQIARAPEVAARLVPILKQANYVLRQQFEVRSGRDLMSLEAQAPVMNKAAAAEEKAVDFLDVRPLTLLREAESEMGRLKVAAEEADVRRHEAAEHRAAAFDKLIGFFKRAHVDLPFSEFEGQMKFAHGELGQLVCDVVWDSFASSDYQRLRHKRAAAEVRELPDDTVEPFCYVGEVIDRTKNLLEKRAQADTARSEYERARSAVRAFTDLMKQAGVMGGLIGATVVNDVIKLPPADHSANALSDVTKGLKTYNTINNPVLNSKLNSIRAESILSDLSTSDPVLRRYPKHELAAAYNDMLRSTPDAAADQTTMRTFLRQYLESSADPSSRLLSVMDLQNLLDVDQQLGRGREFTQSLISGKKVQ